MARTQELILLENPGVTRVVMAAGSGRVKPSEGTPEPIPAAKG